MRDKIRNEEYFIRYIEYLSDEIEETKKILNRHLIEKGEDFLGVTVCRGRLADLYLSFIFFWSAYARDRKNLTWYDRLLC